MGRVRAMAMWRLAAWWPPMAMLLLALLIMVSHVSALLAGKCDVLDAKGQRHTAYVEEISITTNTPPESYIWTLGVALASLTFMCPIGGFLHVTFW